MSLISSFTAITVTEMLAAKTRVVPTAITSTATAITAAVTAIFVVDTKSYSLSCFPGGQLKQGQPRRRGGGALGGVMVKLS